ncbi:MAG: hypothetical protein ACI37S_00645 [Candidatus Gastranaerophilaceae bacterium]
MDKELKKLQENIESLTSDIYFYDMQNLFITNLQKTSPEVEEAMDGDTFDSILESNRIMKEKLNQKLAALKIELNNLTNQKAS